MHTTPPDDHRCTATSSKTGERCTAWRAEGRDVCVGHSGKYWRRGMERSAEVRRARVEARKLSVRDLLARRLEEHADEIVASLLQAVRSGDWRAAEAWLTRVYGKPQESLEVSTPDAFDLTQLSSSELERLRLQLLRQQDEERQLRLVPSAE